MKIGVLSNPLSRRNLKHLRAVKECVARYDSVLHAELSDFGQLGETLAAFAAGGVELVVINGGDGTVSAVMTEIFERGGFTTIPTLAVLPGGTSNTIAGDVGLSGKPVDALRRLFAIVEGDDIEPYIETRRLIRVDYDSERGAVVGMFFGTAAICDAIALRRRMFPQRWIPDPVAGALTLLYVLGSALIGHSADGVLSGETIAIDVDGAKSAATPYNVVIVTTLERIFLGSSPFWGEGSGGLKLTSIRSPAQGLVRHAYRLLYGRDKSALPDATYRSENAQRIIFDMHCPFNLDGEFIQPADGARLSLTDTHNARFLRC